MRDMRVLTAAGAGTAAAFAETRDLTGAGSLQRRSEAANNTPCDGKEEGEKKNAGADIDFAEARNIRRSQLQERGLHPHHGEERDYSRDDREQQAFREHLKHQPTASGTES